MDLINDRRLLWLSLFKPLDAWYKKDSETSIEGGEGRLFTLIYLSVARLLKYAE